MTVTADEALQRLRDGNRRFVDGRTCHDTRANPDLRQSLKGGQAPFAAVLGCADSRVPVEAVFDQGLGDLFVVRVAGHVPTPAPVGSLEFAAHKFGTRLIVVLGHACCGAVEAALGDTPDDLSPELKAIIGAIRHSLAGTPEIAGDPPEVRLEQAVRTHVRVTVDALRRHPGLAGLIAGDGLRIVGAEYALDSGEVTFLDEA
ncbi:MAG: carbonic anhydrase [Gammaproteobacteria bacterium]|nr:carbonic anhydrase [Gammaproteobacteria bacterium]